jgi:hypothetical protein
MLRIIQIDPLSGFQLKVKFDNNETKICSITQFLDKGAFVELKKEELFNQVRNATFSAEWPNELDLSSDTLYSIGQ